jgi:hypothetical protein
MLAKVSHSGTLQKKVLAVETCSDSEIKKNLKCWPSPQINAPILKLMPP